LERDKIATKLHVHYKKWLRYYLDFCHKYNFKPADKKSFPSFNDKLKAKNQPELFRKQAYHAVCLYYSIIAPMNDNPTATSSIGNSMKGGNSEVFVPAQEKSDPDTQPSYGQKQSIHKSGRIPRSQSTSRIEEKKNTAFSGPPSRIVGAEIKNNAEQGEIGSGSNLIKGKKKQKARLIFNLGGLQGHFLLGNGNFSIGSGDFESSEL
jgi:hypothetical protein